MKNYVQPGMNIEVAAPAAVVSGQALLIEDLFGVCAGDAASGETVVLVTEGVFELPKSTSVAFSQGQKVHWHDASSHLDDQSSNPMVGYAVEGVLAAATTVKVKLAH